MFEDAKSQAAAVTALPSIAISRRFGHLCPLLSGPSVYPVKS
jgi:hypothetical protein